MLPLGVGGSVLPRVGGSISSPPPLSHLAFRWGTEQIQYFILLVLEP